MTRLTHRTRCLNRCRRQIEADIQSAVYAEFRWLWRQLYPKLRALRLKREAKVAKRRLIKQIDASSLWAEFQERIGGKIASIIEAAATLLADTESSFWQRRGEDININPADISRRYEADLGSQVRDIGDATRRRISQDVIEWYNTPGATLQSLTDRVKQQVGPGRAATIASTETSLLNSAVTGETMARLGVAEYWFQTQRDEIVCRRPIEFNGRTYNGCRGLHGERFNISQKMPPVHPNCRCASVPIVSS